MNNKFKLIIGTPGDRYKGNQLYNWSVDPVVYDDFDIAAPACERRQKLGHKAYIYRATTADAIGTSILEVAEPGYLKQVYADLTKKYFAVNKPEYLSEEA